MSDEKKPEPTKKQKKAASSRLGREAKIGVAVIAALLIVLVVVVVRRLTAPDPDQLAAVTAADRENQKNENNSAVEKDISALADGSGSADAAGPSKRYGSSQATIVPAKAQAAKPPKAGDNDSDPRKLSGDSAEQTARADKSPTRPLEGSGPPALPPPFMSEPPKSADASMPSPTKSAVSEPRSRYDFAPGASRADSRAAVPSKSVADGTARPKPTGAAAAIDVSPPEFTMPLASPAADRKTAQTGVSASDRLNRADAAQSPSPIPPPASSDSSWARRESTRSTPTTMGPPQSNAGGRTYTVADGDTLFSIARNELGKASRWAELYDMNRDVLGTHFNDLPPGTRLVLPGEDKSALQARQPGSDVQR